MSKEKLKPEMPKEPITIEVPIKLTLIRDLDKYSNGSLLMKLADTSMQLSDSETGKAFGEIGMALGGVFYIEIGEACYALKKSDMLNFYNSVKEIIEK